MIILLKRLWFNSLFGIFFPNVFTPHYLRIADKDFEIADKDFVTLVNKSLIFCYID